MQFNSLTFLVFFALVLVLYHVVRRASAQKIILVAASYLFYGAWNPFFIPLLAFSTCSDWWLAKKMHEAGTRRVRRALLVASLSVNLGLLGYFKYGGFLLDSFIDLAGRAGISYEAPAWDIVLPVGISFYTFQTLSYTIDVYRRRMEPSRSLLDFSLFVSLFCQLVAGPIVRARDFLPQLASAKKLDPNALGWGLTLVVLGLFSKVILADSVFAPFVDAFYGDIGNMGTFEAWCAVFAFSGQIYCDFAGYSTIAIGAALCLGFRFPENFHAPYAACGFSDFWRRWHISLSTWLRDYLYISLGGNRRTAERTAVNLMITMLLGGLWHGASWTFVAWGALHGGYLVAERFARERTAGRFVLRDNPRVVLLVTLFTFVVVSVTWVFFRSPDFSTSYQILTLLFSMSEAPFPFLAEDIPLVAMTSLALFTWHWLIREERTGDLFSRVPVWTRGFAIGGALMLLVYNGGNQQDAFIYFQF
jgi:alginate O-acetyltransferase complex protein AlgI